MYVNVVMTGNTHNWLEVVFSLKVGIGEYCARQIPDDRCIVLLVSCLSSLDCRGASWEIADELKEAVVAAVDRVKHGLESFVCGTVLRGLVEDFTRCVRQLISNVPACQKRISDRYQTWSAGDNQRLAECYIMCTQLFFVQLSLVPRPGASTKPEAAVT